MKLLRKFLDFLSLRVIISALPNTIVNGTIIDATPLMADLNHIVSQVNLNCGVSLNLIPITTTNRDLLTPALGAVIFNTTLGKLQVCTNASGPVWQTVTST